MNNILRLCLKTRLSASDVTRFNVYKSPIYRLFSQQTFHVNTNVIKDVILYKSENDRFFRMVSYFGIAQCVFWSYLGLTAYQTLRDIPVDPNADVWWKKVNFGESKWKKSFAIISFTIGWGILTTTWIYMLRSIKFLILRKGGKSATIVTYAPFGRTRMFTLDLKNMSSTQARTAASTFIPLKVRGHRFHYMIDMNGQFKNAELFDNTAGLKRVWHS